MKIKYNIGTMYSNTDDCIKSIENDLIEHNIINETDSREQILEKVENFVDTISPDIIKGNISILGVTGTVADNVNDINVDEGTWRKILNSYYDFTYYLGYKDYFVCGYNYNSKSHPGKEGLYLVDTITDETTVLCETGYWSYTYTTTDNVLYISSGGDSSNIGGGIGYIEIINGEVKFNHLYSGAGDWKTFYETDKYLYIGNDYIISNSGSYGGILCVDKNTTQIKHLGVSRGYNLFFTSHSGNLYASNFSSYQSNIVKIVGDTAISVSGGTSNPVLIHSKNEEYIYILGDSGNYSYAYVLLDTTLTNLAPATRCTPVKFQTKNKGVYCKSTSRSVTGDDIYEYSGIIYYLFNGKYTVVYNTSAKWNYWLENADGTVFVSSDSSSNGLIKLVDDQPGIKILSLCSGTLSSYISKSGRTYICGTNGYTYYYYNGVEKELSYNIRPVSVIDYTEFFYICNGSKIYKVTDDVIESLGAGFVIGEISETAFYTIEYSSLIKWENGVRTTVASKLKQGYRDEYTFFIKTRSNVVLLKNSILYVIDPKNDYIYTFNPTIKATKGEEITDDVIIFYDSSNNPIYKLDNKKLYEIK